MSYRTIILALIGLALTACGQVHETTLRNGLKVIVKEDHRSPVVVSQVWYKVGASYEPEGLTGISHVLEHMMFKGTTKHKPGEFSRIIAANGGRENAFTAEDYTAYFQQLEKSRLPISFELEADRMQNLLLQKEEFQREVRVVMEERRMRTDDQPQSLTYERFMATAYPEQHPYHHPVIGWMRDLEKLTVDDVRNWYQRWYVPNNAVLVVVGDVQPRAVFALAEKYFGGIPARPVPVPKPTLTHAQDAPRVDQVSAPAEVPYLLLGFHVPVLTGGADREPYALDVLSGILSGGESARFARYLVRRDRIATTADTDYSPVAKYPPMFVVSGVPATGHDLAQLQSAIVAEIDRLRREPVSEDELERVKAQVISEDIFNQDSVFAQAMLIGSLESVGLSWRLRDQYVKNIRAVTAEEVRDVARKYLAENNMTVVTLEPQPIDKQRQGQMPMPGGSTHVR
jgi:zinc protease